MPEAVVTKAALLRGPCSVSPAWAAHSPTRVTVCPIRSPPVSQEPVRDTAPPGWLQCGLHVLSQNRRDGTASAQQGRSFRDPLQPCLWATPGTCGHGAPGVRCVHGVQGPSERDGGEVAHRRSRCWFRTEVTMFCVSGWTDLSGVSCCLALSVATTVVAPQLSASMPLAKDLGCWLPSPEGGALLRLPGRLDCGLSPLCCPARVLGCGDRVL